MSPEDRAKTPVVDYLMLGLQQQGMQLQGWVELCLGMMMMMTTRMMMMMIDDDDDDDDDDEMGHRFLFS